MACEKILAGFTRIPFWPQLPKRSYLENMYTQYSEGVPGVIINEKDRTIHVDISEALAGEIEKAYERYLSDDVEYFAISPKHAEGFYEFMNRVGSAGDKKFAFLKGQVTGPVSFGLAVLDQKKQAIFYNQELQEVLTKVLSMKARWQARKLKGHCENVIIFIDEPYMVSIGSSYVNIKSEEAVKRINEVIGEIHKEGALAGVHCCGNTDWGLILGTDIDIISFDAYNFIESISLYPEALKRFLRSGRSIAWGIVPTAQEGSGDPESLLNKLKDGFDILGRKGIEKEDFCNTSLITPSCGCGTLTESRGDEVFRLTREISERLAKA